MSEIKNGRLDLYGAEHSKCNRMMILGFKGLIAAGGAMRRENGRKNIAIIIGHSQWPKTIETRSTATAEIARDADDHSLSL